MSFTTAVDVLLENNHKIIVGGTTDVESVVLESTFFVKNCRQFELKYEVTRQHNKWRKPIGMMGKYHICDRCYQPFDFRPKGGHIRYCKLGGSDGLRAWRTPLCGTAHIVYYMKYTKNVVL